MSGISYIADGCMITILTDLLKEVEGLKIPIEDEAIFALDYLESRNIDVKIDNNDLIVIGKVYE